MSNFQSQDSTTTSAADREMLGNASDPIFDEVKTGPQHHMHKDDEPLPGIPGARGSAPTVDYTPSHIDHTRLPPTEEGNTQDFKPRSDLAHISPHAARQYFDSAQQRAYHNEDADVPRRHVDSMNKTERRDEPVSMINTSNDRPTRDLHANQAPHDKAIFDNTPPTEVRSKDNKVNIGDKIVGKTEELLGKIARNPELESKGLARTEYGKN